MAQYKVLARSFINNAIQEEGAVVEFDGIPGENLEPLDAKAEKAVKSPAATNSGADSWARQQAAVKGATLEGDDTKPPAIPDYLKTEPDSLA